MQKCPIKFYFYAKKLRNVLTWGHSPLLEPNSWWGETPLPTPHPSSSRYIQIQNTPLRTCLQYKGNRYFGFCTKIYGCGSKDSGGKLQQIMTTTTTIMMAEIMCVVAATQGRLL